MLAKVLTNIMVGMAGALAELEVDIGQEGRSNFLVVGLFDGTG